MMRYRSAKSVPGKKRPWVTELLRLEERVEDRFTGLGVLAGAGVDVAVASTSRACGAPQAAQNREPDSIPFPQEEHWMEESFATEVREERGHDSSWQPAAGTIGMSPLFTFRHPSEP